MSKGKNVASWVIQVLVAALFMMMAAPKLMSDPEVVSNFTRWGLPEKIYLVIGAFELVGAIGLLIPKTAAYAATGLILIMVGALFTHLMHGEVMMALMPIMVMLMLGFVVYARNPFARPSVATGEA